MDKKNTFSHDGIDAFVATLFGWWEQHLSSEPPESGDVAFSDEWERKQIARELHWN